MTRPTAACWLCWCQVLVEIYWSRKSTTLKLFKLKFSACLPNQPANQAVKHWCMFHTTLIPQLRSSKWKFIKFISTNSGTVWEFLNSVAILNQLINTLRVLLCSPTGFKQTAGFNPNNGQFNLWLNYISTSKTGNSHKICHIKGSKHADHQKYVHTRVTRQEERSGVRVRAR